MTISPEPVSLNSQWAQFLQRLNVMLPGIGSNEDMVTAFKAAFYAGANASLLLGTQSGPNEVVLQINSGQVKIAERTNDEIRTERAVQRRRVFLGGTPGQKAKIIES